VQNVPIKIHDCFWTPQEELDVETLPEFTCPVGTELADKEEIKKIEKKSAQPWPTEHSVHAKEKDQSTPSKESLSPSLTDQSMATTSTPWE
jgi:hypothetical protein